MIHWHRRVFVALVALAFSAGAQAIGTLAGTSIETTAQITYTVGTSTLSADSNTTSITVAEIIDVAISLSAATVTVTPGETQRELVFTVTNTGNGQETFVLTVNSALAGDQFDPTPATPTYIYFDTDGSGDLSAGDTPYVPNTNDPELAPDESVRILVVNDIPNTVTDGDRGRSQLIASAQSGVHPAGTVITVEGVEVVIGTSGGDADAVGEYLVEALQISAVKSHSVLDPFNGANAIPGARITYQIVVTASGSGTASSVSVSDPIPPNTTYVPGSLTLNAMALSDTNGDDAGEYATTPTPRVLVNLGNLTAASGPQTITFAVTIN